MAGIYFFAGLLLVIGLRLYRKKTDQVGFWPRLAEYSAPVAAVFTTVAFLFAALEGLVIDQALEARSIDYLFTFEQLVRDLRSLFGIFRPDPGETALIMVTVIALVLVARMREVYEAAKGESRALAYSTVVAKWWRRFLAPIGRAYLVLTVLASFSFFGARLDDDATRLALRVVQAEDAVERFGVASAQAAEDEALVRLLELIVQTSPPELREALATVDDLPVRAEALDRRYADYSVRVGLQSESVERLLERVAQERARWAVVPASPDRRNNEGAPPSRVPVVEEVREYSVSEVERATERLEDHSRRPIAIEIAALDQTRTLTRLGVRALIDPSRVAFVEAVVEAFPLFGLVVSVFRSAASAEIAEGIRAGTLERLQAGVLRQSRAGREVEPSVRDAATARDGEVRARAQAAWERVDVRLPQRAIDVIALTGESERELARVEAEGRGLERDLEAQREVLRHRLVQAMATHVSSATLEAEFRAEYLRSRSEDQIRQIVVDQLQPRHSAPASPQEALQLFNERIAARRDGRLTQADVRALRSDLEVGARLGLIEEAELERAKADIEVALRESPSDPLLWPRNQSRRPRTYGPPELTYAMELADRVRGVPAFERVRGEPRYFREDVERYHERLLSRVDAAPVSIALLGAVGAVTRSAGALVDLVGEAEQRLGVEPIERRRVRLTEVAIDRELVGRGFATLAVVRARVEAERQRRVDRAAELRRQEEARIRRTRPRGGRR